MRLALVLLAGCAASAAPLDAKHPASSSASAGRIAPAPPSLRVGVIAYPDVPKPQAQPAGQHHHHHP